MSYYDVTSLANRRRSDGSEHFIGPGVTAGRIEDADELDPLEQSSSYPSATAERCESGTRPSQDDAKQDDPLIDAEEELYEDSFEEVSRVGSPDQRPMPDLVALHAGVSKITPDGHEEEAVPPVNRATALVVRRSSIDSCTSSEVSAAEKPVSPLCEARRPSTEAHSSPHTEAAESDDDEACPVCSSEPPVRSIIDKTLLPSMSISPEPIPEPDSPHCVIDVGQPDEIFGAIGERALSIDRESAPIAGVASEQPADVEEDPYEFDFSTDLDGTTHSAHAAALSEHQDSEVSHSPISENGDSDVKNQDPERPHELDNVPTEAADDFPVDLGKPNNAADKEPQEAALPADVDAPEHADLESTDMVEPLSCALSSHSLGSPGSVTGEVSPRPDSNGSAKFATGNYSYDDEFEEEAWDEVSHAETAFDDDDGVDENIEEEVVKLDVVTHETGSRGTDAVGKLNDNDPPTSKPTSADSLVSRFKFSRRFLEKKKKLAVAEVSLVHESEGHLTSTRENNAPKKPALPKFKRKEHKAPESSAPSSRGGESTRADGKQCPEDHDEAVRRKLLEDIEQAKNNYVRQCELSGVSVDAAMLEGLGLSAVPVQPAKRHSAKKRAAVLRQPWGAASPRKKAHPRDTSRSLAVPYPSPLKTQLSVPEAALDGITGAHIDKVAFEISSHQGHPNYNGFAEHVGRDSWHPPRKKGGWPSSRYSVAGAPRTGYAKANRFIVAPSTFIKAPKQQQQVLDFYAAPVRFPVFKAAPVYLEHTAVATPSSKSETPPVVENENPNITFSTGPTVSVSPVTRPGHPTTDPPSPISPIKAKIAAAVASATAAAQNASGDGAPIDMEALMRSLAALGRELQPTETPKNNSRAEDHEKRMQQLLHILDPHLERAYKSLRSESMPPPTSVEVPPPKPLSKKELKERAIQDRLEEIAKKTLTQKQYEERRKKKAEEKERREYFYETLEAKKKIARANKKKERARDSHMRVARRIVEDAVTRLQTEGDSHLGSQKEESTGADNKVQQQQLQLQDSEKEEPTGADEKAAPVQQLQQQLQLQDNHRSSLQSAVEAATHAISNQTMDPEFIVRQRRLDEEMLQQQLVRQHTMYEQQMMEQKMMREKEQLERLINEQLELKSSMEQREEDESKDQSRVSSTAGKPTIIMMTKLSPPQDRAFMHREVVKNGLDIDDNDILPDEVPESPVSSPGRGGQSGKISFIRVSPQGHGERNVHSGGNSLEEARFVSRHAPAPQRLKTDSDTYMDRIEGNEVIMIMIPQQPKHTRVMKELPKAHGPAQRSVAGVSKTGPSEGEVPKIYSRYLSMVTPPSDPPPSGSRALSSGGRKVVQRDAASRGSSAIDMADFYEQIALTASQQLPMDERAEKPKNRTLQMFDQKSDSPRQPGDVTPVDIDNKISTTAKKRKTREEEEEEYNRYYTDIFEEFKQTL